MKRIIYSIYTNNLDFHTSATNYKKSQFEKWKVNIENNQKEYAYMCGADYNLHSTLTTLYDEVQFEKILLDLFPCVYQSILFLVLFIISYIQFFL